PVSRTVPAPYATFVRLCAAFAAADDECADRVLPGADRSRIRLVSGGLHVSERAPVPALLPDAAGARPIEAAPGSSPDAIIRRQSVGDREFHVRLDQI